MARLTRDNFAISRPKSKNPLAPAPVRAIDFTQIPDAVARYVRASLAANTRRAYRSDLIHFRDWGGSVPASNRLVAEYLADCASILSVATLQRRLVSISRAHEAKGLRNPTRSAVVRATLHGIRRTFGSAQARARPLLRDDLLRVLAAMGVSTKDVRDRALLLIGFAGGFRRSELAAIDVADIERSDRGIVIHLHRSKADQAGAGRAVGIPFGRRRSCPVAALDRWLARGKISSGPVFRRVDRHANVLADRLSGEGVSLVVKERVAAAGIEPMGYSGHSLRSGLATSAAQAGVSSQKIRQQTGHKSEAMLNRYVRDGELLVKNAAGYLL